LDSDVFGTDVFDTDVFDTVLRAERVVTGGAERPAALGIRDGRIAAIGAPSVGWRGRREVRVGGDIAVLPGLVDSHVHLQDPGRTEWEGFHSGTRAAAAGGITTLVDMPLDSLPVTVDLPSLVVKRAAATGRCHVDVGFWAGVTPANGSMLRGLADAGVVGFKCFLAGGGPPELPPLTTTELSAAMVAVASFDGLLAVHAEDASAMRVPSGTGYRAYLASQPHAVEARAVGAVIDAARRTGARSHVVHVSSADAADLLGGARRDGVRISAETGPHYLVLAAEDVPDGDPAYKSNPPIREAANAERLWRHLGAGVLDMVVSDHSPCGAAEKPGDIGAAFGGISSLQLSLPVMWTACRARGYSLTRLAGWMAARPAALAGLPGKGSIAVGFDADLCLLAPDETFVVDPYALHHRQPVTPYAGRCLTGVVRGTWLRGEPVTFDHPRGRLLTRGRRVPRGPRSRIRR
jgi:allantoinase